CESKFPYLFAALQRSAAPLRRPVSNYNTDRSILSGEYALRQARATVPLAYNRGNLFLCRVVEADVRRTSVSQECCAHVRANDQAFRSASQAARAPGAARGGHFHRRTRSEE